MAKVIIKNLDGTIEEYGIDPSDTSYGCTAIGYRFRDEASGRDFWIHPSTVKRIEIDENG